MPGIVGIITKKPKQINEPALDLMVNSMRHESFYSIGKYLNEQMGVYVGWAVHKDSFADCLPIYNDAKNIILIFYGENHINGDVISDLKSNNHKVLVPNASYLIHLYEINENEFFNKLNGWFCGLLIDLRKKKTILFNDRYGMQRLYFHEDKDFFYFASEAKSILKAKPELKSIPDRSLAELFFCGCVLENRSLFKDIYLLPGGSCWEINSAQEIYRHNYFDPSGLEELPSLDRDIFFTRLKETFREILPKYFRSNGQIAFSLTGGLDTRTILSNISYPVSNVQCYSLGGAYRDCYDVTVARQVAKTCGLNHHTFNINKQFFTDFPSLAEKTIYITDGYMDLNGTPSLYLHGNVRKIGKTRLTGNFGDQVLMNVISLKPYFRKYQVLDNEFAKYSNDVITCLKGMSNCHPLTFFLHRQAPWLNYSMFSLEQSQMVQRSPFMDNDLIKLLYQAPKGMLASEDIRMRLIKEGNPDLAKIPTDRGLLGGGNILFSKGLHLYREFIIKLEYYYSYGMPQQLARFENMIKPFSLEKIVLERAKYFNMRIWFRDELADYVKAMLLDERTLTRPFINRKIMENIIDGHTSGCANFTGTINRVLSTELAIRKFIEC